MQMSVREIEQVENIIANKNLYLEIGSGYSTIYFSQYCNIHSVECRKSYYELIKSELMKNQITNVDLFLALPDKCAFDAEGKETWSNQNTRSDYGWIHEFSFYFEFLKNLISNYEYDTIMIDGNIRMEIFRFLLTKKFRGNILIHDVTDGRSHLNHDLVQYRGLIEICSVNDSLFHCKVLH